MNREKVQNVKTINNNHVHDSSEGSRLRDYWCTQAARTHAQNIPQERTHRRKHSNSRETFKTKVLIIITHIHTNTEQGWAGVGEPAGLVKETRGHLGAAFTAAAVIATKVKWSKVREHAREEEGTVANSQMNWWKMSLSLSGRCKKMTPIPPLPVHSNKQI